jgi:glycosyltransferase involved in cell wall biosynthesis
MAWDNPCLVWDPIEQPEGGSVEYPFMIAEMLDAPVFTHHCHPSLEESKDPPFYPFCRDSITASLLLKSPLRELYINTRYAFWKAPEEYDCIITRGPKAIHTVQRLNQDHVHIFDGSYRGFFLHEDRIEAFNEKPEFMQFLLGNFRLNRRTAIQGSIHTIDKIVAASEWVADVVESLYNREVDKVIYPPMSLNSYSPENENPSRDPFYLYLGNITELHRTEEAIRAFNKLPYTLKVAGDGSKLDYCKSIANDNVELIGYITGKEKYELLASAKGLIVPTPHSFGRVIVESLASGTPVVALNEQYAPYIISEGKTGYLYERGVENLQIAVERFEAQSWDSSLAVERSAKYSLEKFKDEWQDTIYTNYQ